MNGDEQPRSDILRGDRQDRFIGRRRRPDRRSVARGQPSSARSRGGDPPFPPVPTTPPAAGPGPSTDADPHVADPNVAVEPVQLYTPAAAAELLSVTESWLRRKASARLIPCTFLGKHLRFSRPDLAAIIAAGTRPAISGRATPRHRPRRH
jgi:excisionase family DNA binding protein